WDRIPILSTCRDRKLGRGIGFQSCLPAVTGLESYPTNFSPLSVVKKQDRRNTRQRRWTRPMASNPSDPRAPQPGSLQSMLARLRGMVQALKATESSGAQQEEMLPTWDEPAPAGTSMAPGQASPMDGAAAPTAAPATAPLPEPSVEGAGAAAPPHAEPAPAAEVEAASVGAKESPATLEAPRLCPHCQAPRKDEDRKSVV